MDTWNAFEVKVEIGNNDITERSHAYNPGNNSFFFGHICAASITGECCASFSLGMFEMFLCEKIEVLLSCIFGTILSD